MMKTILLLQAFVMASAVLEELPPKDGLAPGLGVASLNQQNLPCTLYEKAVDYEGGVGGSEWVCELFGVDAKIVGSNKLYTVVPIAGMEHVLQANPNIQSGRTTLFAKGAKLKNKKLVIGSGNALTFGDAAAPSAVGNSEVRDRRQLLPAAGPTGARSVLVVRVSGADKSMGKSKAVLSGDWFGTDGDQINLKSNAETCSNNLVTINPGSGTGTTCVSDPDAVFAFPNDPTPGQTYNCNWFNNFRYSVPGDLCPDYGNYPQVGDPNESANTRCCICGGGDDVTYDNNVVNGVMDLQLTQNIVGTDIQTLETAAMEKLNDLFYADRMDQVVDHVVLCFPWGSLSGGANNWAAYGYYYWFISVFNGDTICTSEHDQMHELGHNWGLRHATEGSDSYGDDTGFMGGIGARAADDAVSQNKMCYNGAHSWQLGWYTPYHLEIDPLTTQVQTTLVGIERVPNLTPSQEPYYILKLSNSVKDYYIMFNHAAGQNAGTAEAPDQVTITTMAAPAQGATLNEETALVSKLAQGEHVTFSNWAGTSDSVTVYVDSINAAADGSGCAVVEVWKGLIGNRPFAPAAPPEPSAEPSAAPSSLPSSAPSAAPSSPPEPSSSPSSAPSSLPSSAPSAAPSSPPEPSSSPSSAPSSTPSSAPSPSPSTPPEPSANPSSAPSSTPSSAPSPLPSVTPPQCVGVGGSCSSNSDCCSNKCRGSRNNKSCKSGRRLGAPDFVN